MAVPWVVSGVDQATARPHVRGSWRPGAARSTKKSAAFSGSRGRRSSKSQAVRKVGLAGDESKSGDEGAIKKSLSGGKRLPELCSDPLTVTDHL